MPKQPQKHRPRGWQPPDVRKQQLDAERGSACKRGYDARWRKARLAFLCSHPICVACQARGIITGATEVDHIRPHRGDTALFWDEKNWQSLCKPCHSRKTARESFGHR